jgi:hypothetical protein
VSGFVPLNEQIKEEKLGFWGDLGYGEKQRNGGNGCEMDGRQWCGGEWWWRRGAAVVMGRCLGGGFFRC